MEIRKASVEHDQVQVAIARVRQRFIHTLDERADLLYDILERFDGSEDKSQVCEELSVYAHKLHGISKTIGFPKVGQLAARLEDEIDRTLSKARPLDARVVIECLNLLLDELECVISGD